jgi:competence protein ComEC
MKRCKLFLALALLFSASVATAQVRVHYINVGQADSILLEFKTAAILIDAGGEATGDNRDRDHLVNYLNEFFTDRASSTLPDLHRTLLAVIISHPHIDHTKNVMAVLQGFTVKNFIDGGNTSGSGVAQLKKARTFAAANNIRYRAIQDGTIGQNGMKLFPELMSSSEVDLRMLAGARGCENGNNESLVVLLKYKQASYIFTGDAETENDAECEGEVPVLVDFYKGNHLLDVDVYKVGHHGSLNGTDEVFLEAISPKISVISAGIHTQHEPGPFHAFQFGHPREAIVSLLEQFTSSKRDPVKVYSMNAVRKVHLNRPLKQAVYCTCWDGDIVVSTNAAGTAYDVKTTGR